MLIIENISGIAAGSPMVGTPIILVRRPINPGLIKDLWIMLLCPKTSEMAKEQERKCDSAQILNDHNHTQLIYHHLINNLLEQATKRQE